MLFNWLKNLLSSIFKVFSSQNVTQNEAVHATGTEHNHSNFHLNGQNTGLSIPFYPSLIDHLEMDHKHLLDLYTLIADLVHRNEYSIAIVQLKKFKEDFKAHLAAENIKFYGYLEQNLKDQSEQFAELRRFRKEMRAIERTVIKFLDHWIDFGIDRQSAHTFKTEYDAIGAALVKRIESEELELYTMYKA